MLRSRRLSNIDTLLQVPAKATSFLTLLSMVVQTPAAAWWSMSSMGRWTLMVSPASACSR